MKSNLIAGLVVGALVIGGGSFYGGMKYGQSQSGAAGRARAANTAGFRGAGGLPGMPGARGAGAIGGATNGEVLSKDEKTITLKMRDGGSKIVFYTSSTQTKKLADGAIGDVIVGTQVMVQGSTNSDGSITAQMIQIRPEMVTSTKQ